MTLDIFFIVIGLLLNATGRKMPNSKLDPKSTSKQIIPTKASITKMTSTITKSKATMTSSVHTTIRTTKNPTLGTKSMSKQSISTTASVTKISSTITKSKATMASSVHTTGRKMTTSKLDTKSTTAKLSSTKASTTKMTTTIKTSKSTMASSAFTTRRTIKNPTLGNKSTSKKIISTNASITKMTSTITTSKATMASSVHTTGRKMTTSKLDSKSTTAKLSSAKASTTKMTTTIKTSKSTMASSASRKKTNAITMTSMNSRGVTTNVPIRTSDRGMTSSISDIDSKLVTTRPNQGEPEKDEYHASSVLTVGLPAGSVTLVLIVLITALILICRRRRKPKERSIPMEAMKQQTTDTRNQYKANGNQTYHECEEGTLNQETAKYQGHISSEFGILQDNTISPSGTGKLHDKANFNTGGGTYDVTFTENNPRQVVQVNSYDHMSLKKRKAGDYNNVGIQDQGNALDNAYDKTYPEKCKSSKECEVNTYDMMNFHPQK